MKRTKFNIIICWTDLMKRQEFQSGSPKLIVSTSNYDGPFYPVATIELIDIKQPFHQKEVELEFIDYSDQKMQMQLHHPPCKRLNLLAPFDVDMKALFAGGSNAFVHNWSDARTGSQEIWAAAYWRQRDTYNYSFKIALKGVKDVEWFSKTDPYVKISRLADTYKSNFSDPSKLDPKDWTDVCFSEFKMDNLNPEYETMTIPSSLGCANDPKRPLRVDIWDFEDPQKTQHVYIGSAYFTFQQLVDESAKAFVCKSKKGESVGTVYFKDFKAQRCIEIEDYLLSGLKINSIAAVDYSKSNGEIREEGTLHCLIHGQKNAYERAMEAILPTLFYYDADKTIPLFGIASTFPSLRVEEPKYFFKVLGRSSEQKVPTSTESLIHFYRSAFTYSQGCEPTLFTPALKFITRWVSDITKVDPWMYTVVAIFTDGLIDDETEFLQVLNEASQQPVSFVFVVVGGNPKIRSNLRLPGTVRNNAYLIDFEEYAKYPMQATNIMMREIPKQMVEYYQYKGIQPSNWAV
jgi:Copine